MGFLVFGWSLFALINNPNAFTGIYFVLASTLFIYVIGRIYGLFRIRDDFIELTKDHLAFRSTPPFGTGWLPKNRIYKFDEIAQVDIIEIVPFQNPDHAIMALQLKLTNYKREIVGNNLSQEQIVRVGLALKGTVALSNSLQRILGKDDVGEQLKDIVDIGKSLWNSLKSNRRGDE